ncbi:MAG: glycosyltransferase, partial [Candidatus Mariimomonas ferrooxydans]
MEKKGHKVIVFSMHHPQNFDSEYSKYFVSYINYEEEIRHKDILSGIKVLNRTIYSREAKKKIEKLIKKEKPDIAHLQNIHHHITPSIFYPLKKHNVPIIWTLHDYTIICPSPPHYLNHHS